MSIKTFDSLISYTACHRIITPSYAPFLGASRSRQDLLPRSRGAAGFWGRGSRRLCLFTQLPRCLLFDEKLQARGCPVLVLNCWLRAVSCALLCVVSERRQTWCT